MPEELTERKKARLRKSPNWIIITSTESSLSHEEANESTDSGRKALKIVYDLGLVYSSMFNTLAVAAAFGIFSVLLLFDRTSAFSSAWFIFTIAYFVIALGFGYLYLKNLLYAQMTFEAGKRLGIVETAQSVYNDAATGPHSKRLTRWSYKLSRGIYTPLGWWVIIGAAILLVALWVAVALTLK